ncbi:biotin--[acetyl-CoA-carboxylase] ligase [Polaribacter sp. SA4-12]|uniref:biotin--[acetyl-CoA-carboxylase] ligase n=1 Tax=Polaribacter sp. SA4-12 TaxID=1312072 RepID=UPI000B3CE377|nr:biotin--[acetyl-CoA-carboxylase] ligase [Polaribacter sp. SA4-12]ARV14959.1 biotin--[acetyl-CoA-carboxylase] ligase [Polaribacter sp. SA4-12]
MKIIKLDAIDSTNSFLKNLSLTSALENLTVVVTQKQSKGRGQQESSWISEPYKNLTFSVFISLNDVKIIHRRYLNFAISLSIYNVLFDKKISKLSIKWPNDILSANKKICGILIENSFFGDKIKSAIVGIGLNVNQEIFPNSLPNVTSLKLETKITSDLDVLLNDILIELQNNIKLLESKYFHLLEKQYLDVLYKKNIPTMFKNSKDEIFMGFISGVSDDGNLQIQLEDDSIAEFGIKEVSIL